MIQKIRFSLRSSGYEIRIGHDLLDGCGKWARKSIGKNAAKVGVISDPAVFRLYGDRVKTSLVNTGFEVPHFLIKAGESNKNLKATGSILGFLAKAKLPRTDAVIALGGGVVGDLAGFAAAIYLRGIAFLQVPTTLLSMIDSSVGGKTGVNLTAGKNLVGAFHQPKGVLIDTSTLTTLTSRELTAGFCEAIKQGAISGRKLLDQTSGLLTRFPPSEITKYCTNKKFLRQVSDLVASQVTFKARIVAGDGQESVGRRDPRSRKILNFGHTLAHALEKVTNYQYFKHGEAVGYGILFAAELSKNIDLCAEKDVKLLNDVVHPVGPLPRLSGIGSDYPLETFPSDKKPNPVTPPVGFP